MKRNISQWLLVTLIFAAANNINAQDKTLWKGKKCAVSLTYDDALNVHLDKVMPQLDSAGFKGTFYLIGSAEAVGNRLEDWRKAAAKGHELGNHTLFHPCTGKIQGREWVNPERDLSTYTVQRMVDEVKMTNAYLKAIDGKTQRTYAYTCGDIKIGNINYFEQLKMDFVAARGVRTDSPRLQDIDIYDIGAVGVNGQPAQKLIEWVKRAMEEHTLVVFLFHGVGGEHSLNEPAGEHKKLIEFLKQNQDQIWVAPMIEVAQFIKEQKGQAGKPAKNGK